MTRLVSLLDTRKVIHLSVEPAYIGYTAIDSNTYEAEYLGEDRWKAGPMGMGKTEAEAIDDLLEKLE